MVLRPATVYRSGSGRCRELAPAPPPPLKGCEFPHTRKPVARGVTEVLSSVFHQCRSRMDLPADDQRGGHEKQTFDALVQVADSIN